MGHQQGQHPTAFLLEWNTVVFLKLFDGNERTILSLNGLMNDSCNGCITNAII
jgi:hypothetical protein